MERCGANFVNYSAIGLDRRKARMVSVRIASLRAKILAGDFQNRKHDCYHSTVTFGESLFYLPF
jgi:hypothetical protein